MATGRSHDIITVMVATPLTGYLAARYFSVDIFIASLPSCLLGGLYLSPDLDLDSTPFHRWQRLGLGWYWRPYRDLIPHRSPISHAPVIGTICRVLYLLLPLAVAMILDDEVSRAMIQFCLLHPSLLLAVLAGIEISALAHILSDLFPRPANWFGEAIADLIGLRKRRWK